MNIVQTFYDKLATDYDKLFLDWDVTTIEHAIIFDKIFIEYGFRKNVRILDCAFWIGTQIIGLASIGYSMNALNINKEELKEAEKRAYSKNLNIDFRYADFCKLSDVYQEKFDITIATDNALPHMLTKDDLKNVIKSIINQLRVGGIFVASMFNILLMMKIY